MKFRRLKAIAVKEILQVWRDPRSLMIALLLPFTQMFLLGYGVNLDLKHLPICPFDREGSQLSQDLLKRFQASQYFAIAHNARSYSEVSAAIDDGQCALAIVIPPDFSERLSGIGNAPVQAILDGTDDNTANIAFGYAAAVVAGYSNDIAVTWIDRQGKALQQTQPMAVQSRVWFNEDLESRNFIIPGLVAMIMALVGAQLTSLTISREWERGTMELLISTPVKPIELMLGKLMPYLVLGWLDAAFCLGLAALWFGVPYPRHPVRALCHHLALPHRRSQHRLSDVGADPQPSRRQPDCAFGHDAADHFALRLHLSDRSDAEGRTGRHLPDLFALLRLDRQRPVPERVEPCRTVDADCVPCRLCVVRDAACRPGFP